MTPERELVYAWKDQLENLRAENVRLRAKCVEWITLEVERGKAKAEINRLEAESTKLRAALQRIVDEADSDDGLTAWDGSDIARAALKE